MRGLSLFVAMSLSCAAAAQTEEEFEPTPPPPELPEPLQSGAPIEPDVTIIRTEEELIEEYRINGQMYMVKVTPSVGPVYYLIDRDGDGTMESRVTGIRETLSVPQWVIYSW